MSEGISRQSRRSWHGSIALFLVLAVTPELFADVTDFTWTPAPINVGQNATYTAVDNGTKTIASCKWEYQYVNGTICTSGWFTGLSNSTTQSWFEATPGLYNVRMTVTYAPVGAPPVAPPQTIITKPVTVVAADGFVVTKGYNTSVANGGGMPNPPLLEVDFKITCAGNDAGTMIAGFPQELITNKTVIIGGVSTGLGDDPDWTPATGAGGGMTFYKQGNLIIDMKSTNFTAADWNAVGVGDVFYTFTQSMRINWTDPCGNVEASNLGSINLARKKVSATEWQLVPN